MLFRVNLTKDYREIGPD